MISEILILSIIYAMIFLLVFVYLVYPALLFFLSKVSEKKINSDPEFQPSISILISAYNEEKLIEEAVRSIFKGNYDNSKINVYAGSDGSDDNTYEILLKLCEEYDNLHIYDFQRTGKNGILNKLAVNSSDDFIFYMDADCRLEEKTISKLTAVFADKSIGAVIANMIQLEDENSENAGGKGEGIYQKYETNIRHNESVVYSTVNSLGAFYGIRKENYRPLPNDMVCDDYLPLLDTALNRQRIYFVRDATVYEVRGKSLTGEVGRRIRVAAGGMATVWEDKNLLKPIYGITSFFLWSHKVLRWLSPFYLIILAVLTLIAYDQYSLEWLLIGQIILYLSGFLGWIFEKIKIKLLTFRLILYFLSMNFGFLLAFFQFLSKRPNAIWNNK